MKLIVGLGNPGKKYENSRHNIGFMVLDKLLQKIAPVGKTKWKEIPYLKSKVFVLDSEIVLAKPQTMMNASGYAVEKLITNYKILIEDLWVVHDDLDLPLGKIKIARRRGSAGHHGVESIIQRIKTDDFVRFRLGIGRPLKEGKWAVGEGRLVNKNVKHKEVEEYVLEEFSGKEKVEVEKMIKKTVELLISAFSCGLEKTISQLK